MLADVLPGDVALGETFTDVAAVDLDECELAGLSQASPARKLKSATVRDCARRALAQIGAPLGPLPRGNHGEPIWPDGVVGSMTHCAGYRAAAVAWERDWAGIGIDAEPHRPPRAGILDVIARSEEGEHIRRLSKKRPDICWDLLLFSAKEAAFKCVFPAVQVILDFDEISIEFDSEAGAFAVRLMGRVAADRSFVALIGRWVVIDGLALTAVLAPTADRRHQCPSGVREERSV